MRMRSLAVVAAVVTLTSTAACGNGDGADENLVVGSDPAATEVTVGAPNDWRLVSEAPLSPRQHATAVSVGDDVVVFGGDAGPPCPPAAHCDRPNEWRADGAILDLDAGGWRKIADAPTGLGVVSTGVIGDVIYVWEGAPTTTGTAGFFAYDVSDDRWDEVPLREAVPPGQLRFTTTDDRVVASVGTAEDDGEHEILAYDPMTRTWEELPEDPLPPLFNRSLHWAGGELILMGAEAVPNPGVDPSFLVAAAYDPDTARWRRLADSEVLSGWWWVEVDGLIVGTSLEEADGGEVNNYGRSYPFGGVLDPGAGTWTELPEGDPGLGPHGANAVGGDGYAVGPEGLVLDMAARRWLTLPDTTELPSNGAAVAWADRHLVVFGGLRWEGDRSGELRNETWLWAPEARGEPADSSGTTSSAPTTSAPATATTHSSAPTTAPAPGGPAPGDLGSASQGSLADLDLRLEIDDATLAPGEETQGYLVVENNTGATIVDPGCRLSNLEFGVLPADEPDAPLHGRVMTDCGGSFPIPPGYSERHHAVSFNTFDGVGEPLEPGSYLAVVRHGGGIEQLSTPLRVVAG